MEQLDGADTDAVFNFAPYGLADSVRAATETLTQDASELAIIDNSASFYENGKFSNRSAVEMESKQLEFATPMLDDDADDLPKNFEPSSSVTASRFQKFHRPTRNKPSPGKARQLAELTARHEEFARESADVDWFATADAAGREYSRDREAEALLADAQPHLNETQNDRWKRKRIVDVNLQEKDAANEAFSTFSLHVGDVSFKLAQAALAKGEWPDASKTRIEEFVNAFDYGDPLPTDDEKVSCTLEQSIHPFLQQRNLLRVAMRTAATGRSSTTPLRLTFLLDNSGSMERPDRRQTVQRAFATLANQLNPLDQVTLNSFARRPRLLADQVNGAKANELVNIVQTLPSEGGTNIEAALQLGFEKAREQQLAGAQNRVVLLTDGAVNLGNANPENLSRMVANMRDQGIAFDAAGISAEGLNDEVLEALTRQGDGRYYLLDSAETVDDGFARQIAGALRPSAKNVKVQVEFNSLRVGKYKLLGFEKHRLNKEDFRDDKVDAAELAAEEAGVALYQFEAKPDGEGDVGSVSVRFQDAETGEMVEQRWPIPYRPDVPRVDQASPSLQIATSAAMLAAKFRNNAMGDAVQLDTLSDLVGGLPVEAKQSRRVQQLEQMIRQARNITGQ